MKALNKDDLDEWLEHPVTLKIKAALGAWIEDGMEQAKARYWDGNPPSEAERLSLKRAALLHEFMFTATEDDINEWNGLRNDQASA